MIILPARSCLTALTVGLTSVDLSAARSCGGSPIIGSALLWSFRPHRPSLVSLGVIMDSPQLSDSDLDDWEEWDRDNVSFTVHALAGSCAGVMEHVAMFPMDTLKTHMQASPFKHRGDIKALVRKRGFLGLWRGAPAVAVACVPSHAAYFSVYEAAKARLGVNEPGHHPFAAGAAGALATTLHDAVLTPMDVVKQRLQLGYYRGAVDCVRTVLREEGWAALYRSYPTTVIMNFPYAATVVATNESLKKALNPSGGHDMGAYLLSGAGAGCVAAIVTNPLDVVKTRLQTQSQACAVAAAPAPPSTLSGTGRPISAAASGAPVAAAASGRSAPGPALAAGPTGGGAAIRRGGPLPAAAAGVAASDAHGMAPSRTGGHVLAYEGLGDTARKLYAEGGARAFMQGVRARVMLHTPSMAISWGTYEFVKRQLATVTTP